MRLFHTSELRHPTARSLHAAWLELQHSNMLLPPAVAEQLAPISAGAIGTDINLAETLLANHRSTDPMHASRRLAEESWWFTMWRNAESPYTIVHPTAIQEDTVTSLLNDIDPRCFPVHHIEEFALVLCRPELPISNCEIDNCCLFTALTRAVSVRYDPSVSAIQ